ncbi:MAG TPA: hypothetical protein VKU19_29125 [Bryobacteraceae bacterium]|nr:hypothetical protein [Bryobacteraceae bacterium]
MTYAMQDPEKHDDVAGAGRGYVDQFSQDRRLLVRLELRLDEFPVGRGADTWELRQAKYLFSEVRLRIAKSLANARGS